MKYPKKDQQDRLMGKKCFFDGEYYRDYLKKKIGVNFTPRLGEFSDRNESVPVRWKIFKHCVLEGWIVGFGYCFDGTLEKEMDYKYFRSSKRVNYVRVRTTPSSKELKIPLKNIRLQSGE